MRILLKILGAVAFAVAWLATAGRVRRVEGRARLGEPNTVLFWLEFVLSGLAGAIVLKGIDGCLFFAAVALWSLTASSGLFAAAWEMRD